MKRDEYAQFCLVIVHCANEVANVCSVNVFPAFNGYKRLTDISGVVLIVDDAINTFVSTLFTAIARLSIDKRNCP